QDKSCTDLFPTNHAINAVDGARPYVNCEKKAGTAGWLTAIPAPNSRSGHATAQPARTRSAGSLADGSRSQLRESLAARCRNAYSETTTYPARCSAPGRKGIVRVGRTG